MLARLQRTSDSLSYPTDPLSFTRQVLGLALWDRQAAILSALEKHRYTIVETGHGVGKSIAAAAAVCWWLCTRHPAKVITTAPTWPQVNFILWSHIRTFVATAGLPGEVLESAYWRVGPGKFAIGLSPRKDKETTLQTFQGYHGPNLLVIIDEGAAIPVPFWNAAKSLVASESDRLLVLGNPLAQQGPFYEACHNPTWHHIQISCLEHPNVQSGMDIIHGAVSRTWVEERLADWATPALPGTPGAVFIPWQDAWYLPGPAFEARVLGRAPSEAEDQLIRLAWIQESQLRWTPAVPPIPPVFGLDVARLGRAASVLIARTPNKVLWIEERHGEDVAAIVAWLKSKYLQERPSAIFIDEPGVGGGVLDIARREGLPVVGVNMGSTAANPERFRNRRAECWWRVREALQNGTLDLPPHDGLTGDLLAMRVMAGDKIELEKKEKAVSRLGRTLDYGDALALTFAWETPAAAQPLTVLTEGTGTRWQGTWHVPAGPHGSRFKRLGPKVVE